MQLPPEIIRRICELVYLEGVPLCTLRLVDPLGLPSAAENGAPAATGVDEICRVLYALCLVSRAFYRQARPLLFRRVHITMPYRFMHLVELAQQSDADLSKIRLLDCAAFRALGLRRTVGESFVHRFVTPERLLTLINAATGLVAFGSCETMDSALTLDVLESLLFRAGEHSHPGRMRDVSVERNATSRYNALQSLDLCGCISPRFVDAMHQFVAKHLPVPSTRARPIYDLLEEDNEEDEPRGRSEDVRSPATRTRSSLHQPPTRLTSQSRSKTFPALQRLGLAGVTINRDVLSSFVLSFPNLTHLDLSRTRADAQLLQCLAQSNVRLESLSLSRCRALTSQSITELLVLSPTTRGLRELALQGTLLFPTPLSPDDLRVILTSAPCMHSGALRYLDLGGCPFTDAELQLLPPQPLLLDLGLGALPNITLAAVSDLLQHRTPNVEILDLAHSAGASMPMSHIHAVSLFHELLAPCTQRPPAIEIFEQLRAMGLKQDSRADETPWVPPTNLRVVELSSTSLSSVRGGVGTWKVVWGAGRRGWVVDTAAGVRPDATDLPEPEMPEPRGRRTRREIHAACGGRLARNISASPAPRNLEAIDADRGRSRTMTQLTRSTSQSRIDPVLLGSTPLERSRSLTMERRAPSFEHRETCKPPTDVPVAPQVTRNLAPTHPRRQCLEQLAHADGSVPGTLGWHSHKMEVLLGYGLLGRELGNYAWLAYQVG